MWNVEFGVVERYALNICARKRVVSQQRQLVGRLTRHHSTLSKDAILSKNSMFCNASLYIKKHTFQGANAPSFTPHSTLHTDH